MRLSLGVDFVRIEVRTQGASGVALIRPCRVALKPAIQNIDVGFKAQVVEKPPDRPALGITKRFPLFHNLNNSMTLPRLKKEGCCQSDLSRERQRCPPQWPRLPSIRYGRILSDPAWPDRR